MAQAENNPAREPIPRISVHAESKIGEQKFVLLKDVAELSGFDSTRLENLNALEIIETPERGANRRFSNIGFAQILRAKLQEIQDSNKIVLNIPSEVLILRKSTKLESSDVESELLFELKKQCLTCEYEISSLVLPILNEDLGPGSRWKIKIENQSPKGSFSIPLEVISQEGAKRLYWLTGHIIIRKLVPVAKRNINNGENIKDDDFNYEKKDITYLNDNIASLEDLKFSSAIHNIMPNQIIGSSVIRKQSLVRAGDTVKVFMGEDGWQVSIDGVAQQNAYKGDFVKVKIQRTQKIISGLATDKGMVEIR